MSSSVADSLYDKGEFKDAEIVYRKANRFVKGLSPYCSSKILACQNSTEEKLDSIMLIANRFEGAKSGLLSDMLMITEIPDKMGDLLNEKISVSLNGNDIVMKIWKDSNQVEAFITEVNYNSGEYKSKNDTDIEQQITSALTIAIQEYGKFINRIHINYIGSSDGAGFLRRGRLKIDDDRLIDDTETVKELSLSPLFYKKIKRSKGVEWIKGNFNMDDLFKLNALRDIRFKDQKGNSRVKSEVLDENYAKNLLLAHLRAKMRHLNIVDLLKKNKVNFPISNSIYSQVEFKRGEEHRYVQLEILIKLRR